jgi:hypothetical protein
MSLERHFRSDSYGTMWLLAVLAFIAFLGVIAAREVASRFLDHEGHSSISADSHHDQRPRFDHGAADWNAPGASVLPVPPTGESPHIRGRRWAAGIQPAG